MPEDLTTQQPHPDGDLTLDEGWTGLCAGGDLIRALRRAAKQTQLWVEAEAGLGTGYLQRVEAGKVAQPTRETVERILAALDARHSERRLVLAQYGYALPTLPPTEAECEWARAEIAPDLLATPFPAYLLDCLHRLMSWNRLVPRMFGIVADDPTLGGLAGRSLPAAWFDPASTLPDRVADPDSFFPALIQTLRYEMRQYGAEPWQADILTELLPLPLFRHYWEMALQQPLAAISQRALVPIRLRVPRAGTLTFRLVSEPLTRDHRFRTIGFVPADTAAMQWCVDVSCNNAAGDDCERHVT